MVRAMLARWSAVTVLFPKQCGDLSEGWCAATLNRVVEPVRRAAQALMAFQTALLSKRVHGAAHCTGAALLAVAGGLDGCLEVPAINRHFAVGADGKVGVQGGVGEGGED